MTKYQAIIAVEKCTQYKAVIAKTVWDSSTT